MPLYLPARAPQNLKTTTTAPPIAASRRQDKALISLSSIKQIISRLIDGLIYFKIKNNNNKGWCLLLYWPLFFHQSLSKKEKRTKNQKRKTRKTKKERYLPPTNKVVEALSVYPTHLSINLPPYPPPYLPIDKFVQNLKQASKQAKKASKQTNKKKKIKS